MDNTEKSLELIKVLKRRPKMILTGNADFYSIKTFLIGYIQGLEVCYDIELHKRISGWFQNKIHQSSSLFWTEHVEYYYQSNNDDENVVNLLRELESFFIENPLPN
jgi:hypothetical protein